MEENHMEGKHVERNNVMERQTLHFLAVCLGYAVCFAFAFYKNYVGVTFPVIVALTLAVCGVFRKKSGFSWRRENHFYVIPILLLGISTAMTTNWFVICFNTVGILLLLVVYILRQVYPEERWSFGQFLCNILYYYICMIPQTAAPFLHLSAYRKRRQSDGKKKNPYARPVALGVLIGLPMLLFVVGMLNSADAIFEKYVGGGFRFLWEHLFIPEDVLLVAVLLAVGFFASYSFLNVAALRDMPKWEERKAGKNPVTAITFIGMITVVYLVFCAIQLLFLFTGGFLLPEGYTYAEYAHQGFFQLLFLCIFNPALVLLCLRLFERNWLLKLMLTVFSGCTFVLIASSALRMILYISCYHLTFLRVLVLWFLALLTLLMAGVICQIHRETFSLFRYGTVLVTVFYLALSLGRPDYWIASYNVSQMGNEIDYEDMCYLASLSQDAAPVLARLHPEHEDHETYFDSWRGEGYACPACVLEEYFQEIKEGEPLNIRTFNLSKYLAKKAVAQAQAE